MAFDIKQFANEYKTSEEPEAAFDIKQFASEFKDSEEQEIPITDSQGNLNISASDYEPKTVLRQRTGFDRFMNGLNKSIPFMGPFAGNVKDLAKKVDFAAPGADQEFKNKSIPKRAMAAFGQRAEGLYHASTIGKDLLINNDPSENIQQYKEYKKGMINTGNNPIYGAIAMAPDMAASAASRLALGAAGGLAGPGTAAAGAFVGGSLPMYIQGAGDLYVDMLDEGVDPKTAKFWSLVGAAPYAALENVNVFLPFSKMIPGGKKAVKEITRKSIKNALSGPMKQALTKGLKTWLSSGTKEAGEEFMQEMSNGITIEIARSLSDAGVKEGDAKKIQGLLAKSITSFIQALPPSLILGAFGGAVDTKRQLKQNNQFKDVGKKLEDEGLKPNEVLEVIESESAQGGLLDPTQEFNEEELINRARAAYLEEEAAAPEGQVQQGVPEEAVPIDTPAGQEIIRKGQVQFFREQEFSKMNEMTDAELVETSKVLEKSALDDVDLKLNVTNRAKLSVVRDIIRERAKVDDANNVKMSDSQNAVAEEKIDQVNAEGSTANIKEEKVLQEQEQLATQIEQTSRQILDQVRVGNMTEVQRLQGVMDGLNDQLYGEIGKQEEQDVARQQTREEVDVQQEPQEVQQQPQEEVAVQQEAVPTQEGIVEPLKEEAFVEGAEAGVVDVITESQKEQAYNIAQKVAGQGNEDVASEVYLGVLKNYDTTKGPLENYVKRAVNNKLKSQGKDAKKTESLDTPVAADTKTTKKDQLADEVVENEELEQSVATMKEAINDLPQRQKQVANMLLKGMTKAEIARKLLITNQSVQNIESQFLAKLKRVVPDVSFSVAKKTQSIVALPFDDVTDPKAIADELGLKYQDKQGNNLEYSINTGTIKTGLGANFNVPVDSSLSQVRQALSDKRDEFTGAEFKAEKVARLEKVAKAKRSELGLKGNVAMAADIDSSTIPSSHIDAILDAKKEQGITGKIEGVYLPKFDIAYYFTDNIKTEEDMQRVVMHEATARGLNILKEEGSVKLLSEVDKLLTNKKDLLRQSYKREVADVMDNYPQLSKYLASDFNFKEASKAEQDKARKSVIEVMEHIGENRNTLPRLWDKVVRIIKDLLSKINPAWGKASISQVETLIDNGLLSTMSVDSKVGKSSPSFSANQKQFSDINPNDKQAVIEYLNNTIKILGRRIQVQERAVQREVSKKQELKKRFAEAKEKLTSNQKAKDKIVKYREMVTALKDNKKSIKDKQTAIIKYARSHIPPAFRFKLLTKLRDLLKNEKLSYEQIQELDVADLPKEFQDEANLQKKYNEVIEFIDEIEKDVRHKNAIEKFKKTLKRVKTFKLSRLAPERKAAIQAILDTVDLKPTKAKLETLKLVADMKKDGETMLSDEEIKAIENMDGKFVGAISTADLLASAQVFEKILGEQKIENKARKDAFVKDIKEKRADADPTIRDSKTELGGRKDKAGTPRSIYRAWMANLSALAVILDKAKKNGVMQGMVAKFRKGTHKAAEVFREVTVPMEKLYNDLGIKEEIHKWQDNSITFDRREKKVYKDANGKEFQLSKGDRISMYLHSLNEDNLRHLTSDQGGFIPSNRQSQLWAYKVDLPMLDEIINDMTSDEIAVANEMSKMYDVLAEFLNKESMKLNGFTIADVVNYFPIIVDHKSLADKGPKEVTLDDIKAFHNFTVEGMGMTKLRNEKASQPLILSDAFTTLKRSTDLTSKYYGYASPLRWSKALLSDKGENNLRSAIVQTYGKETWNAIKSVPSNIEAGLQTGPLDRKINAILNTITKGRLGFNLPVAVMQTVSYNAAVMEMDNKYWAIGAKSLPASVELMGKHSAYLWKRYHESEISIDVGEAQKERKTGKGMKIITKMDSVAVGKIWKAMEAEVKDKRKDLKPGSDEFYAAVADRTEYIVHETQPTFDLIDRPYGARQNNYFARVMFRYSSQLIKNYGMQIKSWQRYKNSDKTMADKSRLVKERLVQFVIQPAMIGAIRTSTRATRLAIMAMLGVYTQRDDDDIFKVENFLEELVKGIIGASFSSLGQLANTLAGMISGFSKKDPIYNIPERTIANVRGLIKAFQPPKKDTRKERAKKLTQRKKAVFKSVKDLSVFTGTGFFNLGEAVLAVPAVYNKLSKKEKDDLYNF